MRITQAGDWLSARTSATRGFLKVIFALGLASTSALSFSQDGVTTLQLHGKVFTCQSSTGRLVPFFFSESANALGGGAATVKDGKESITFSPSYLQKLPAQAAFFVAHHECAHLALPMGIGLGTLAQESNADCYAVRKMQANGLLTSWSEFSDAMVAIKNSVASSMGHLPGPDRIKAAAACLKVPVVQSDNPLCKVIDRVFSGGPNFPHFRNTNSIPGLPGFYCEADTSEKLIYCKREFDSEGDRLSYENSFVNAMNSCLPAEFIRKRKVHIWGGWENSQAKQSVGTAGEMDYFSFTVHFNK